MKDKKVKTSVLDEKLVQEIYSIITDSRFIGYGYRRAWAVLRFDRGIKASRKKVQRIMKIKKWQAKPVKRPHRYEGESYEVNHIVVNKHEKVTVEYPNIRWATDLTKVYVDEVGWANFIPVIDCGSRDCVGWRLDKRGRALEAREALQDAVITCFGSVENVPNGLAVRTDNGSIFLANAYRSELKRLGIQQEYTPYRCPDANGVVERFIRTIKEECIWQYHFRTLKELEEVVAKWIKFYNNERRHSGLGYMTPSQYRESLRKLVA